MEEPANCRETDIVCIASELLARWDLVQQSRPEPADEKGRECAPCIIEDWNADVDD